MARLLGVGEPAGQEVTAAGPALIVVFDLDNTLVHSRIDFLGIREAVVERLLARQVIDVRPADLRERAIPEWVALAEAANPQLAAELWSTIDQFERAGMLEGTVEVDVAPTLERLRDGGARLAVLTNNSLTSARAALEAFRLDEFFPVILARGNVAALKPDGAGVRQAHDMLGGGPTTVVGDSYLDGLAAHRAAIGASFVAFRPAIADLSARGVRPQAIISTISELPKVLNRLHSAHRSHAGNEEGAARASRPLYQPDP